MEGWYQGRARSSCRQVVFGLADKVLVGSARTEFDQHPVDASRMAGLRLLGTDQGGIAIRRRGLSFGRYHRSTDVRHDGAHKDRLWKAR